MATFEIEIGRDVLPGNFKIPCTEKMVSKHHAKVVVQDGRIELYDLDSTNGTFVNGLPVRRKCVKTSDVINLGGAKGYAVRIEDVINAGKSEQKAEPLSDHEYKKRVEALGTEYDNFQDRVAEMQTSLQTNMMMIRMGPGMALGVITSVLAVIVPDNLKAAIGVGGAIVTLFLFIMANKWAAIYGKKQMKKRQELQDDFYARTYVCPDPQCRSSWQGKSYKQLWAKGMCPYCKRKFT